MNDERTDQKPTRRAIPFHPVLLAVEPIIFVYAYNGAKIPIDPGELLLPIALSLAMTATLWAPLSLAFRSVTRAALVVSLFLVFFFSYGHVAQASGPKDQTWSDLFLFWVFLMAAGTWLVARRSRQGTQFGITVLLNSIAVAILLVNLPPAARAFAHRPRMAHAPERSVAATGADYPDIYYITLDGYARSDVLKSHYHTDNSAFLGELSRLGFFVADRAHSNYAQTYLSLASSLNFTYLDSLAEALGPESGDHGPLIEMIQDSRLVDFLRRRGYTISSFATGLTGTDLYDADVHFAPRWALSEFQTTLENTTLLQDVLCPLLHKSPADQHRDRVLYAFRELPNAGLGRHPVFVWAHVVSPHPPFVFDARGERPSVSDFIRGNEVRNWLRQSITSTLDPKWYDEYYGPQVAYLNTLVEAAVRRILVQSPRPPIIVIQGDHGPGSLPGWRVPRRQLLEQHAIFCAVYLPPSGGRARPSVQLYDSISPVNTFRVILSQFFDTTLALLPDRSYLSIWLRPYRLYDAARPDSYPVTGGSAREDSDAEPKVR